MQANILFLGSRFHTRSESFMHQGDECGGCNCIIYGAQVLGGRLTFAFLMFWGPQKCQTVATVRTYDLFCSECCLGFEDCSGDMEVKRKRGPRFASAAEAYSSAGSFRAAFPSASMMNSTTSSRRSQLEFLNNNSRACVKKHSKTMSTIHCVPELITQVSLLSRTEQESTFDRTNCLCASRTTFTSCSALSSQQCLELFRSRTWRQCRCL